MENNYFLILDCLQNFQITDYDQYREILSVSKDAAKRIRCLSILNLDYSKYSTKLICNEKLFPLFRNLTNLYLHGSSKIRTIDMSVYAKQYKNKYGSYPCLLKIKMKNFGSAHPITILTELVSLNVSENTLSPNTSNALSYLTCLKLTMNSGKLTRFACLNNLKTFKFKNARLENILEINNAQYTNLRRLTIFSSYCGLNISFNNLQLTYLHFRNNEGKASINLDRNTSLRYLKLRYIQIIDSIEYFRNASRLYYLRCNTCENEIELSKRNNPCLRHLILENINNVVLYDLTNVVDGRLNEISNLKIDYFQIG